MLAPASKLQVRFEPANVQITRGSDAWLKRWDEETDQVTVELTYPAPIVKVHSPLRTVRAPPHGRGGDVGAGETAR